MTQDFKKFENKEYTDYINLFKKSSFKKRLENLSKKYKNKKVLIYGNGIFFDALADSFDLNSYFNIKGVSDIRYLHNKPDSYKNFKVFNPYDFKNENIDVIICSTINPAQIYFFMKKHGLMPDKCLFDSFLDKTKNEVFNDFMLKNSLLLKYLKLTLNIPKTLKYALFLNSDEINSKINYLNGIKNLKKRNKKTHPLRVLFIVEENAKWGYQSVYDILKNDPNFEVLPVLCYPIITKDREYYSQSENIEFFKNLGIEAVDGCPKNDGNFTPIDTFKPDIVFYQQPWYVLDDWHPCAVSKYALSCIVSYGYSSIDVKSWGSIAVQNLSGNLWKMFCESPYHKTFYEKAAKIKHKEILKTTGYPKMDYYKEPVNPYFEALWKDGKSKRPRIIWAPHHSIDQRGLEMSNFMEHYRFFLDFAKNNKNYSFIFKPHPMLEFKCISEGFMTKDEYDTYIQEWNTLENASVWDKGDYFDIFKTSDILITDCSSFLGEYCFSQKPIIFLDKNSRCGFNDFGLKMKKTFYIPQNLDEIPQMIYDLLINKNDYKKEQRIKLIKQEYFYPSGGVGKMITEFIRKELDIQ